MAEKQGNIWKGAISAGLIAGGVSLLLALVGMVAAFSERYIITGVFTMGQFLLLAPLLVAGYISLQRTENKSVVKGLLAGALAGLFAGLLLTILLVVGQQVDLRQMFPNASPELYSIISFGVEPPLGYFVPFIYGAILGTFGAGLVMLPNRVRSAVLSENHLRLGICPQRFIRPSRDHFLRPDWRTFLLAFGQARANPQAKILRTEASCAMDCDRTRHRDYPYAAAVLRDFLY
jgi:hypothetical protein